LPPAAAISRDSLSSLPLLTPCTAAPCSNAISPKTAPIPNVMPVPERIQLRSKPPEVKEYNARPARTVNQAEMASTSGMRLSAASDCMKRALSGPMRRAVGNTNAVTVNEPPSHTIADRM